MSTSERTQPAEGEMSTMTLPTRAHVYQNHHIDSTIWDDFTPRPGDIVINTAYKAGTTWMQQIVGSLIFRGEDPPAAVTEISPWLDMRVPPRGELLAMLEAQEHRRFLKSHLPLDGLRFLPACRYIYVGRDGRDVFMSLYNHYRKANDFFYQQVNETPGRVGPPLPRCPEDPLVVWDEWMSKSSFPWERDGWPFWSLFHHVQTWWEYRHLPNILFVHFNQLKADLAGEIRRIAAFLEIPLDDETLSEITRKSSFGYMKTNARKVIPNAEELFHGGSQSFINKGTNGRWRALLSEEEVARYEALAAERMTPACRTWLATGAWPEA